MSVNEDDPEEDPLFPLLRLKEVCKLLECSRYTIRRRILRGEFPPGIDAFGSNRRVWSKAAVERWFREHKKQIAPNCNGGHWDGPLLTLDEVCQKLQRSDRTVRRLIAKGVFPAGLRLFGSNRLVWKQSTVDRWLRKRESNRRKSNSGRRRRAQR